MAAWPVLQGVPKEGKAMKYNPTTRRQFLEQAGAGSLAAFSANVPLQMTAAIEHTDSMKIISIEAVTFRRDLHIGGGSGGADGAEFLWIRLHTAKGIVGTGESYPHDNGQVGALKDYSGELKLLGRDPRDVEGIWRDFYFQMAMRNAGGVNMRVVSALNMAQVDILGQASRLPLYALLGGKTRPRVPTILPPTTEPSGCFLCAKPANPSPTAARSPSPTSGRGLLSTDVFAVRPKCRNSRAGPKPALSLGEGTRSALVRNPG